MSEIDINTLSEGSLKPELCDELQNDDPYKIVSRYESDSRNSGRSPNEKERDAMDKIEHIDKCVHRYRRECEARKGYFKNSTEDYFKKIKHVQLKHTTAKRKLDLAGLDLQLLNDEEAQYRNNIKTNIENPHHDKDINSYVKQLNHVQLKQTTAKRKLALAERELQLLIDEEDEYHNAIKDMECTYILESAYLEN